jgi:hypothetical protein
VAEKSTEKRSVFAITEKGDQTYWTRIGAAFFSNKDGSINVELDAVPVSGRMQIREDPEREERGGRREHGRDSHSRRHG